MTQTRSGTKTQGNQPTAGSTNKENVEPKSQTAPESSRSTKAQGRKRPSTACDKTTEAKKQKTKRTSPEETEEGTVPVSKHDDTKRTARDNNRNSNNAPTSKEDHGEMATDKKPRLTTPDLEFDYDRSQLRDPRPTPGRHRRPRRESIEMTETEKREIREKFTIPEPEKPKGRLNAFQKDKLFGQAALLNPMHTFHDLHVCHQKGRNGSPTYDSAGFQLDYHKVADWMRPKPYNKSAMVNGMQRSLDKKAKEEEEMYKIFFVDGKAPHIGPSDIPHQISDYVKDQVSKDIGVPFHQIAPAELRTWEQRGFQKVRREDWWREPNEEERKRMSKMQQGRVLRKDL